MSAMANEAIAVAISELPIPLLRKDEVIEIVSAGPTMPFSRLTIDDRIGDGGSGLVYRAKTASGRVAVKVPRTLSSNFDVLWEGRFSPPVSLPANDRIGSFDFFGLALARIPSLRDLEIVVGISRLYAKTVHTVIESSSRIASLTALRWAYQVSLALDRCGVVHRDIKPDNLFVDDQDNCLVGDFGMAIPSDPVMRSADEYSAQYLLGTPEYASPEQWAGDRNIDHRSDIYAIGLVLFEMVTGKCARPPLMNRDEFNKYGESLARSRYLVDVQLVLCENTRQVIESATRSSPGRRYQSHAEFREACRRAIAVVGSR